MNTYRKPYLEFGKQLADGIRLLANDNQSMKAVMADLAEQLGYSPSTVYGWREGLRLPSRPTIEALAHLFVQSKKFDQIWISNFLTVAEYGTPDVIAKFVSSLFGIDTDTEPNLDTSTDQETEDQTEGNEVKPALSSVINTWKYKAESAIASVAIQSDSELFVASTKGKAVSAFDRTGGLCWHKKVNNEAWRTAISQDNQTIVVGTGSNHPRRTKHSGLYCLNVDGSSRWQVDLDASVWDIAVSNDGDTIAIGTSGKQIILFDGQGNRLWHQDVFGFWAYGWVWSVALSADGQLIIAGAADRRIRFLARSGVLKTEQRLRGDVSSVAVTDDGLNIAAGDNKSYIYWFTPKGILLWEDEIGDAVWKVALSNNGQQLLVGAGQKEAHLRAYDRSGQIVWRRYVGHEVTSLAINPNGTKVAVGTRSGEIYIFAQDGEPIHHFQAKDTVQTIAISTSGDTIVAGSTDGYIYGFDLVS